MIAKQDAEWRPCIFIIPRINNLQHKINIVGFPVNDIQKALLMNNLDLEDNIQFVLGEKMGCYTYVTNNIKDFRYNTVEVVEPSHIRNIGD